MEFFEEYILMRLGIKKRLMFFGHNYFLSRKILSILVTEILHIIYYS